MLEIDDLTVAAGAFRLEGVRLKVAAGERHVILGPSGVGKTTLLETVIGFRSPDGGRMLLAGRPLAPVPIEERGIGYVPQRLALFPHLTVRENIAYSARVRSESASAVGVRSAPLVEAAGIGELMDRRPDTLSGGERQRVALVRALASAPRLLLLDEPFTALNETLRRDLWWLVKRLQEDRRITTLMITHDLTEAFFLGERVSVLIDGRIHQSAPTREVYRRPATEETARFLGIRNLFAGTVEGVDANTRTAAVRCPALDRRLLVPLPPAALFPAVGAPVVVGIRPEYVALRDAAHPPQLDECTLTGSVEALMETGAEAMLLFRPAGAGFTLDIRVGLRVLRKFRVRPGQGGVVVGLPREDLFLTQP